MNARLIVASVVGAIVSFLLGWLIFGILAANFYTANMNHFAGLDKMPPDLIALFAANFFFAFMMAYIFDQWAKITTWMEGAKAGAWLSFLWILSFDLFMWAFMNVLGKKVLAVDVLLNAVLGAIIGAVIAFVLGYKKAA